MNALLQPFVERLSEPDRMTFQAISQHLMTVKRLGVSFSGGVDSALLTAVAAEVLGRENVVAILGVSPSLAKQEHTEALQLAQKIGVELVEVYPHEDELEEYRKNATDRCYHCKSALFSAIDAKIVEQHNLDAIAYGENADDAVRTDRPGAKAATEYRVLRPLASAGVTKPAVRSLARALDLSVADKPASPCLASRIPHGQEVTPDKLRAIDDAEACLRGLGLTNIRVRHHGEIARIEVPADQIPQFADENLRRSALQGVREAGFRYVTLDLAGLQSGMFTLEALRQSAHG